MLKNRGSCNILQILLNTEAWFQCILWRRQNRNGYLHDLRNSYRILQTTGLIETALPGAKYNRKTLIDM